MSLDPRLFGEGFLVVIRDLSGGNGAEPVERIRGFRSLEHANEFARRYVRDSIERCRAPGMSAEQVLEAWFAFGEDAEVPGGWSSGAEIRAFAETPLRDAERRNWRVLDPRRHDEAEDDA
ncbi:MAG: hypothetical protein NZM27_05565 [Acetobacteraceae bacterium]|nr:hypothetical protein [Acetobacteraceae bacterium]MCX7684644.1 hypothetical protein [Acetobacteraceae bacterium]MDW8399182.1 hypothetical protein [Acetobacteraceae bacterium]